MGDGLPEKMCVQCVLQVSRAFTFKQQCERSDTTLRTYYQSIQESMTPAVTVSDETSGAQSVEVQFQDPTNGEKCFLVVQQISMMNTDDLVTFSDDNKIVGNVICQEDVVGTETSEPNDSLSDINFVNDDVIKLEDSSSLALVDVEDLESEIITDSYGKGNDFNKKSEQPTHQTFQTHTRMMTVHRIRKILFSPPTTQSRSFYSKPKKFPTKIPFPNPLKRKRKINNHKTSR